MATALEDLLVATAILALSVLAFVILKMEDK